ncbi:MAG TPA: cysteine--tRNA ligase [Candidatus Elarobacter sp.]|jgi:cysteinyl-tRNA synthetase
MPLRLFNTRTRAVDELKPLEPDHVRIYVCGLTPSAEGHLGHARSFLFFDVLRRYLENPRNGYRVTFVKNVTDVDDRAIATAQREGTTFDLVVKRYYDAFRESMRILNVREPDDEPYATRFVPQIVEMIGELIATDHAYVSEDGVYYAVHSFPRYGALSGKNVDELLVGARIAENEHKRDPLDFALWKFAKPGEPRWASPWGAGRPGWHIECSAMSRALLGVPFDVHGGGYDLIFPHHENEIAQSEALMPAPPMAEMWVHGGLLNFEGRKMSKSLGNFEPLSELLKRHDPLAIRLLFLQTGYRKPMNFTEESIAGAKTALERLRRGAREMRKPSSDTGALRVSLVRKDLEQADREFFDALDSDMDTSRALSVLFFMDVHSGSFATVGLGAEALAKFREYAGVLGLEPAFDDAQLEEVDRQVQLAAGFVQRMLSQFADVLPPVHPDVIEGINPNEVVSKMVNARAEARKNKDFALGDRLRDALAAEGIALKDSKDGTTWTAAGA